MSIMEMRREAQEMLELEHFPEISADTYAELLSMDYLAEVLAEVAKRHMKLKDLAKRLGIKPSTLSRRLGSTNLTLKTIAEFALALGMEVDTPKLMSESDANDMLDALEAAYAAEDEAVSPVSEKNVKVLTLDLKADEADGNMDNSAVGAVQQAGSGQLALLDRSLDNANTYYFTQAGISKNENAQLEAVA